MSRAEREEAERQRYQHPVEDGRKCLVEGVQHPQRIVSTGGLDDAERQSEQNAEKNDADELRPRQRSEDIGRHHALQERHDRTAGFDRRLAGELLAERRGGALAQAFARAETDAHQHRRRAWNQQQQQIGQSHAREERAGRRVAQHLSDAPGERRHEDGQHAHRQQGDVKFRERHQRVGRLGQIESEQQPGDDPCDDGRRMRDDSQDLTQQSIASVAPRC